MKEITNRWLARNTRVKGVIACGVRYPDQTTFNQTQSHDFPAAALDESWNCVAGTFEFLKQHQKEKGADHIRWVFENFYLYCAMREDEACLGVFTSRKDEEHDPSAILRMIAEFKALRGAARH